MNNTTITSHEVEISEACLETLKTMRYTTIQEPQLAEMMSRYKATDCPISDDECKSHFPNKWGKCFHSDYSSPLLLGISSGRDKKKFK
jgi:hypothetical protein